MIVAVVIVMLHNNDPNCTVIRHDTLGAEHDSHDMHDMMLQTILDANMKYMKNYFISNLSPEFYEAIISTVEVAI